MHKIRKGDEVIVLTGKDKSRRGVVSKRVDANYLIVDGINVAKKHQKANPYTNTEGGIVEKALPIHVSNVAIYNPETGKKDKVQIHKDENGRNKRVFRSTGKVVGVKA